MKYYRAVVMPTQLAKYVIGKMSLVSNEAGT